MSVMSTQRVEEVSHLSAIGYLSIGETPLEAWRPDVAFQSNRGQAALDEECLHLPIPGPKRNM